MSLERTIDAIADWAGDLDLRAPAMLFSPVTAATAATVTGAGRQLLFNTEITTHQRVLRAFAGLADDFAVTSLEQLFAVLAAGVDASRVVFRHPVPTRSTLRTALRLNVRRFVLDDQRGLRMLRAEGGAEADVILCLSRPGAPVPGLFGDTAVRLRELAAAAVRTGGKVEALCCPDDIGPAAIAALGELHSALARDGIAVPKICIGDVRCAAGLAERVGPAVSLVVEPGPDLVAPCVALLTQVVADRTLGRRRLVHLDLGAFRGLSAYDAAEVRDGRLRLRLTTGRTVPAYVAGKWSGTVPAELSEGDLVIVPGCGLAGLGQVADGVRGQAILDVPTALDEAWIEAPAVPVLSGQHRT